MHRQPGVESGRAGVAEKGGRVKGSVVDTDEVYSLGGGRVKVGQGAALIAWEGESESRCVKANSGERQCKKVVWTLAKDAHSEPAKWVASDHRPAVHPDSSSLPPLRKLCLRPLPVSPLPAHSFPWNVPTHGPDGKPAAQKISAGRTAPTSRNDSVHSAVDTTFWTVTVRLSKPPLSRISRRGSTIPHPPTIVWVAGPGMSARDATRPRRIPALASTDLVAKAGASKVHTATSAAPEVALKVGAATRRVMLKANPDPRPTPPPANITPSPGV